MKLKLRIGRQRGQVFDGYVREVREGREAQEVREVEEARTGGEVAVADPARQSRAIRAAGAAQPSVPAPVPVLPTPVPVPRASEQRVVRAGAYCGMSVIGQTAVTESGRAVLAVHAGHCGRWAYADRV